MATPLVARRSAIRINWFFFMPDCWAGLLLGNLGLLDSGCNVYAPFSNLDLEGISDVAFEVDGRNFLGDLDENGFLFSFLTSYHEADPDPGITALNTEDLALHRVFVPPHRGGVGESFLHGEGLTGKALLLSLLQDEGAADDDDKDSRRDTDDGGGVETGAGAATHILDSKR